MNTKQAKTLAPKQETVILDSFAHTRYPTRNRVMFLLSVKAGLRAKEIAELKWEHLLTSDGAIGDVIDLPNTASKGKHGGRVVPLNKSLKMAVLQLWNERRELVRTDWHVIYSERNSRMSANSVTVWFHHLYRSLGMVGCSSHSGRRTFITRAAQGISKVGGSLRDVQSLAGHSSLANTQRYIEVNLLAKRQVVDLV
ncbi:MAG: site-specific integrase [Magnetococcales bacterium]|nr:site-specific integrase [Magnetococcales bacterium]